MTLACKPLSVALVTQAITDLLLNWPPLADLKVKVERADELNTTPGRCPWIGVYRDSVEYASRTLGGHSGARIQRIQLVIAVQESDGTSGQNCEDRLETLLAHVISALLTDNTLSGLVQMIEEVQVRYTDYRKVSGGSFMQTAAVYLTAVNPVQVTEI